MKDYCPRQFVDIAPLEPTSPIVPIGALSALGFAALLSWPQGANTGFRCRLGPSRRPALFQVTLMASARGKQVELILAGESETERARWMEALARPSEGGLGTGGAAVYADWDAPQVQATHDFRPEQEDELPLAAGDVVKVLRKMPDGWLEGERLRDGAKGWFPGSYVVEILSDHVRARNYRARLRLIQAAESLQMEARERKEPFLSPAASPLTEAPPVPGTIRKGLRRISAPLGAILASHPSP